MDVGALFDCLCPGAVGAAVFDLVVDHAFVVVEGDDPVCHLSALHSSFLCLGEWESTHFAASSFLRKA